MAPGSRTMLYTFIGLLALFLPSTHSEVPTTVSVTTEAIQVNSTAAGNGSSTTVNSNTTSSSSSTTLMNNNNITNITNPSTISVTTTVSSSISTTVSTSVSTSSISDTQSTTPTVDSTSPSDSSSGPGVWLLIALIITIVVVIIAGIFFYRRHRSPYRRFLQNWRSRDDDTDNIILQLEQPERTDGQWPPRISFT